MAPPPSVPLASRHLAGVVLPSVLACVALDAALGLAAWGGERDWGPFLPPLAASVAALLAVGLAAGLAARACARPGLLRPAAALLLAALAPAVVWTAVVVAVRWSGWLEPASLGAAAAAGLAVSASLAWVARDARPATVVLTFAGVLLAALGLLVVASTAAAVPRISVPLLCGLSALLLCCVALALPRLGSPRAGVAVTAASALLLALVLAGGLAQGLSSAPQAVDRESAAGRLEAGRAPAAPRRVILVLVDTLRRDALSCLADDAPATPAMDGLAQDSVVFAGASAPAPWTLPSMASMLTGLGPDVHLATQPGTRLPRGVPTLAEAMRAAGYRTAAIGQNGMLKPSAGLARGFDGYDFFPRFLPAPPLGQALLGLLADRRTSHHLVAGELTDLAVDWLEHHGEEDFFLWLHYYDPHVPYAPPPGFRPEGEPPPSLRNGFWDPEPVRSGHWRPSPEERDWMRALYRGEVRYCDRELGRLFEHLRARGLYDDTLIVLTSDHGEEFWEHDGFEHGHSVHDEVLAVPLLVKLPGGALAGVVEEPVLVESVAPTVLALAGLAPDPAELTSPPLIAPGADGAPALAVAPRPLISLGTLVYEERLALVDGGEKLVLFPRTQRTELYDLRDDPAEQRDLASDRPRAVERLRALWRQRSELASELRARFAVDAPQRTTLSAADEAELRALGYVR